MVLLGVALLAAAGCALRGAGDVPNSGPAIVVDAGHGGQFTNHTASGLREEELNLDIAVRLAKLLESRGYRVIMTRKDGGDMGAGDIPTWGRSTEAIGGWELALDWPVDRRTLAIRRDLQARCNIANEARAAVLVSIHNNASTDPRVQGSETFAGQGDEPGLALAASIVDSVSTRAGTVNRREHESGLYLCRFTDCPAVIVEGAYLTNAEDARRLKRGRFRQHIAEGIADGLDRWFASYPRPQSGEIR